MIEAILNGIRLHEKLFALLLHIEAAACERISIVVVVVVNDVVVDVVVMVGALAKTAAIAICRIDRTVFYFWTSVDVRCVVLLRMHR